MEVSFHWYKAEYIDDQVEYLQIFEVYKNPFIHNITHYSILLLFLGISGGQAHFGKNSSW